MTDEVFTPYDFVTKERYRWPMDDVRVIEGNINQRGHPWTALVEVDGCFYKIDGAACSLEHCYCDATAVKLDYEEYRQYV